MKPRSLTHPQENCYAHQVVRLDCNLFHTYKGLFQVGTKKNNVPILQKTDLALQTGKGAAHRMVPKVQIP